MRLGLLAGVVAVSFLGLGRCGMAQTEPEPEPVPVPVPMPNGLDHKPLHIAPLAPVPPGAEGRRNPMRPEFLRAEKVTWIGIGVSPVTPLAEHQLKLPPGVGLVVDEVMPDSPAAKAGLQEYDILHKLDDQLLVNPEQLATLVRMHKSGEEITLTVIREGKPTEVKVTLAEHSGPPMMPMIPGMHPFFGPRGMVGRGGDGRPPIPMPPGTGRDGLRPGEQSNAPYRLPELKIMPKVELQLDGDKPQVVIKDSAGHTLFSKSLDFQFDTGKGPVQVHVQVGASASHADTDKPADDEPKVKPLPDDRD